MRVSSLSIKNVSLVAHWRKGRGNEAWEHCVCSAVSSADPRQQHDVLFARSSAHDKPTGSMGSSLPWHSLPAVALSGGWWWCEEAGPLRIAGREAVLAITDVRRAPAPDLIGCRCSACSCWLAASASTLHVINHAPRHSACLLYTSPSPRDRTRSRMPSSA